MFRDLWRVIIHKSEFILCAAKIPINRAGIFRKISYFCPFDWLIIGRSTDNEIRTVVHPIDAIFWRAFNTDIVVWELANLGVGFFIWVTFAVPKLTCHEFLGLTTRSIPQTFYFHETPGFPRNVFAVFDICMQINIMKDCSVRYACKGIWSGHYMLVSGSKVCIDGGGRGMSCTSNPCRATVPLLLASSDLEVSSTDRQLQVTRVHTISRTGI